MRWLWVVAAFTVTAIGVEVACDAAIALAGLDPVRPISLDDPRLFLTSMAHLASAVAASAVAWKVGRDTPGLGRPRLLLWGLMFGALLVSATVGLSALASGALGLGACASPFVAGLRQLVCVGPTALGEEVWLRGTAMRATARGTHPVFAVVGTGLVFGALHLMNPDATVLAALNVALVGIWFGAMAWRAQSIWPAIGAHLAWNWFEGFFWGQNVSGIRAGCSLLTASSQGGFFSGGDFGPEASALTAVLLALACALTLALTRR